MSWKQQKMFSVLAIVAALLVNCLPVYSTKPPVERTASVAP
jgi:hypothetical protein